MIHIKNTIILFHELFINISIFFLSSVIYYVIKTKTNVLTNKCITNSFFTKNHINIMRTTLDRVGICNTPYLKLQLVLSHIDITYVEFGNSPTILFN